MHSFRSSSANPNISTLTVACSRSSTEACGRDEITKPQQGKISRLSIWTTKLLFFILEIHQTHQKEKEHLYQNS